ncbi:hypothetical protein Aperf_G00000031698 [Anoplocephala perfoliata]
MWKNPLPQKGSVYKPTTLEKIANTVTHLSWIPTSIRCASKLVEKARTADEIFVAYVYGPALISLFGASSAYHCCSLYSTEGWYHSALHFLDRLVIFLFIAASYTPWLSLREFEMDIGQMLLKIIWTTALCGSLYQYFYYEKCKLLDLVFYLTIGVLPALFVTYIKNSSGMYEVAAGGLIYIAGIFFFRMDGRIPLAHAIWHCFVALAAFLHYGAIERHLFTHEM